MAVTVRTLQNFIGGDWVDATGDEAREIVGNRRASGGCAQRQ